LNKKKFLINICKKLSIDKLAFHLFSFSKVGLARYSIIRSLLERILPYFKLEFIEIDGNKIFLDSNDSLNLSFNSVYEKLETDYIKKEIKEGDIVFDIGANIGYYTLLFAKLVGNTGKVFAFEPDPTNFAILKKNIETNGYQNVTLIQKAISDKTAKIRLYLCNYNNGMHRIYDSTFCDDSVEIESVRLDDFLDSIVFDSMINFIKIDVEGAEFESLQGMKSILKKNISPKILLEFAPFALQECGYAPKNLLLFLKNLGFELNEIDSKGNLLKIDIDFITKKFTATKKNYLNLVCIKK